MKRNKVIILASIIIGVLVVTLGLTYAAITFNETKGNSQLVLGDIWMHYGETNQINLQNAIPTESYLPNGYFEFTVDGKNTYTKKDIWYEIVLNHGDYTGDDATRTIRIDDQLLKFKLVEVEDGEEIEIFNDRTYSDLTNKRIHVDTISSTDNNYSKTYRLYMRVAEYTTICGGDATDGCDYYLNPDEEYANLDWNKLFASIKVNVLGDFEEKSTETEASCFGYEVTSIENPTFNSIMANQEVVDNELSRCMNYWASKETYYDEATTDETFCQGTGTDYGWTFQKYLDENDYSESEIQEMLNLNIIQSNEDGTYIVNPVMLDQDINELTKCIYYFSNNSDFALSEEEDFTTFCKGSGTLNGTTFQISIDNGTFDNYINELASIQVITGTSGAVTLTSYGNLC